MSLFCYSNDTKIWKTDGRRQQLDDPQLRWAYRDSTYVSECSKSNPSSKLSLLGKTVDKQVTTSRRIRPIHILRRARPSINSATSRHRWLILICIAESTSRKPWNIYTCRSISHQTVWDVFAGLYFNANSWTPLLSLMFFKSWELDELKLLSHILTGPWKNFYFNTSLNILVYTYMIITDLADLLCVVVDYF